MKEDQILLPYLANVYDQAQQISNKINKFFGEKT